MIIACSGCGQHVQFSSSSMSAAESRRNVVSYALRLASFASGIGFAGYHTLFGQHLGMSVTSPRMFHRVIEEAYPHITNMLDSICELGKDEMKALPILGSWGAGNEQLQPLMAAGTYVVSFHKTAPL